MKKFTLAVGMFALAIAPDAADEKIEKNRMPKPLEAIAIDVGPLEEDGLFTVIDVRYEEVEEGRKAVVWTLKANQEMKCEAAGRFLKNLTAIRYYRGIKGSQQEVTWGFVHLPTKVSLLLDADSNVLKRNESIDVWVDADDDLITTLKTKKATKAEFSAK